MWLTYLVVDHREELKLPKLFPPFTKGGEILIYKKDNFDNSQVPVRYVVNQVIFDVYSTEPTQWVHVTEVRDE